jgi:isocitrate/isopropylmalate dehydrogenase
LREKQHMKSYDIAVIGGDGTGPEVTREALKVSKRPLLNSASNSTGILTTSAGTATLEQVKCCRTARWMNCGSKRFSRGRRPSANKAGHS